MPFVERESNDIEIDNAAENVDEGKSSNKETKPLKLFMCPEEGCLKSFFKDGNLQRHLLRGTHSFLPERTNLQDQAIQSYSNQLENIRNVPYFPEMQEALQVFYLPHDEVNRLEMGWALKEARNCKVLSAISKIFLLEKYNFGIDNRKKLDAKTVAKEMRQNGRFQKSEFLSEKQVESFWSREAAKRRQQEPITYYTENQEELTKKKCSITRLSMIVI